MKNSNLNVILIIASFSFGYSKMEYYKGVKIGPFSLIATFSISLAFVLAACAFKDHFSDKNLKWTSPKFANVFKFYKQPLQDYYVSSLMLFSYSLGLFVASYIKNEPAGAAILYLLASLGGIIGINISKAIFKKRLNTIMPGSA